MDTKLFINVLGILSHQVFDLTWSFNNQTIHWSNTTPFKMVNQIAEFRDTYWYSSNDFCTSEHGGTHFDAPYHFNENGWKVNEIPLDRLIIEGVVIDLRDTLEHNPEPTLTVSHLQNWEKVNGPLPDKCVILVKFGWSKYYHNETAYYGFTKESNGKRFPGISHEASQWITSKNKVYGVGIDTASIDPGSSKDFISHRVLYKNNIYGIENLNIPDELPARGFILIILPMKIETGSGGPCRVFALVNSTKN